MVHPGCCRAADRPCHRFHRHPRTGWRKTGAPPVRLHPRQACASSSLSRPDGTGRLWMTGPVWTPRPDAVLRNASRPCPRRIVRKRPVPQSPAGCRKPQCHRPIDPDTSCPVPRLTARSRDGRDRSADACRYICQNRGAALNGHSRGHHAAGSLQGAVPLSRLPHQAPAQPRQRIIAPNQHQQTWPAFPIQDFKSVSWIIDPLYRAAHKTPL